MKQIPLANRPNLCAIVDDDDYQVLVRWAWLFHERKGRQYVVRYEQLKMVLMHRVVMSAPVDKEVDHRDTNGLNNQKSNLRLCSHLQNQWNRKLNRNNTSGFKGVWRRSKDSWHAEIKVRGKKISGGNFSTREEAAKAYDELAVRYFGEFARLNFN